MVVAGIEIELIKKDIKNLHLAVYPPDGKVRLASPLDVNEKTLELYVASKIPWIRRQQRKFAAIERQSPRQYINRESHYFLGKRYLLRVHEIGHTFRYPKVICKTKTYIDMYVREGYNVAQKSDLMKEWYRGQLKNILGELIPKWEMILQVKCNGFKVYTMKTKWGSCNTEKKSINFNIQLAQKSIQCIEYIIVHELTHIIERKHNDVFRTLLDKHLPNWQELKSEMNLQVNHCKHLI
jgi:predicted metal-dependent hydrolase